MQFEGQWKSGNGFSSSDRLHCSKGGEGGGGLAPSRGKGGVGFKQECYEKRGTIWSGVHNDENAIIGVFGDVLLVYVASTMSKHRFKD
jgi:hypothetical protein